MYVCGWLYACMTISSITSCYKMRAFPHPHYEIYILDILVYQFYLLALTPVLMFCHSKMKVFKTVNVSKTSFDTIWK